MGYIQEAKSLCIERDAGRCRHCGAASNLFVNQLVKRKGPPAWQLSNLITLCGNCSDVARKSADSNDNNKVGVLLCGGRGTRLAPLTRYQGKHALPVGLVPMVLYPLKTLRAFGVKRVLVVVDRETAGEIVRILGGGKEFGFDSVTFAVQEGAAGIGDALCLAKDFVRTGEKIITILGDNIFDYEALDKSVDLYGNKAIIYTKKVNNPEDYGVAIVEGGKVKEVIEKPKQFISDRAVVGLYIYTPEVFDVIKKIKPSERGELEISDINSYYAKEDALIYKDIGGYWADCGGSIQRYYGSRF